MYRSFLRQIVRLYGVNTSGLETVKNHQRAVTVPGFFRQFRRLFLLVAGIFLLTAGGVRLYGQTANFRTVNGLPVHSFRSTAPDNPVSGMIYFNTVSNMLYSYDGSRWQALYGNTFLVSSYYPVAQDVAITGPVCITGTVHGSYKYIADVATNYVEGNSVYQWYQADDGAGTNPTAISGATSVDYTIPVSMQGRYISIGIKPRNMLGATGVEVRSTWQVVQTVELSYSGVSIGNQASGCAANGTTVTAVKGTYSTNQPVAGSEGTPLYQWYWATDALGTGKTAISGQTGSTHTVDVVNTSFGYNNYSYLAVGITPQTVAGTKGSEVLSAWVPVWKCGLDFKVKHTYASGGPVPASSNTDSYTYGTVAVTQNSQPVCWITRNLGATANATLVTDAGSTSRGWFWQFNRKQGYSWDGTTEAPATRTYTVSSTTNWVLANDPCRILLGDTWRVPAKSDWENVLSVSGGTMDNLYTKINLHRVGFLELNGPGEKASGVNAFYWSSLVYNSEVAYAFNYYSGSSAVVIGVQNQNYGFPVRCVYLNSDAVAQCIPSATGVSYNTDHLYTSGVLTGQYTYVPDNTLKYPEQLSTYQWYQATDASGTGNTAISGATTTSYTIPSGMTGKYLRFGVKPRNELGNSGVEVFSSWGVVLDPVPAYASASIGNQASGCAANGTTVTADKGTYSTTPPTTDSEGTPVYQWYWATDATGTGKTAISGQTGSTHTVDATKYGYNNYSYLAVGITPKTLGGVTGIEVLSAWAPVWKCGISFVVLHPYVSGGPTPYETKKSPYTYGTVVVTQNSLPVCWITRNLGATADATSVNDAGSTSRGWFWQFNRKQGYFLDGTIETPGTRTFDASSSINWVLANDPCRILLGDTWRMPAKADWDVLSVSGGTIDNLYTKINLHRVGYLDLNASGLKNSGVSAHYWSSLAYKYNSDDGYAYSLNSYPGRSDVVIEAQNKIYGFPVRCVYLNSDAAAQCIPSATGASFTTDHLYTSGVLTGTYTYTADTKLLYPEGDTSFQWYQATDASGAGKIAISGATTTSYTIPSGMIGKYLRFGVKPRNILGNSGVEVFSSWGVVLDPVPAYASSSIGNQTSGCAANGTTVTAGKGTYSVTPAVSGSEGTPVYQWYWATDASGTGKTAISGQTGSTHTVDASNTSFGYNNYCYLAVGITPKTLGGKTGSEVLSAWVPVWKCGLDFKVKHTYASGGSVPASSNNGTFTYGTVAVTQNSQPVCWITRNLGATANASLVTDAGSASRGWFWQFNQKQGYSWDGTTEAPATRTYTVSSSTNWVSANDPCRILLGDTWRVPTKSDWENVLSVSGGTIDNLYTKINLHRVGYLELNASSLTASGVNAHYWSSLVYNSADAYVLNSYSGSSAVVIGAQKQNYGFPVRCVYLNSDAVAQCIPSATGVSYNTDRLYTSGVLTGTYTYTADTKLLYPEGDTSFQWYQATDASGAGKTAISGATTTSYTIPSGMIGKYLRFGVKPRNIVGYEGVEVFSSWGVVLDPVPAYASSSIGNQTSGCAANGTTVTADKGTYSVTPAVSGSEGTPVYQWYWATDATGTGKTAISGQTGIIHVVDASNTSFGYNNYSYLAVGITPKTVAGTKGSEVLSAWVPVWKCGSPYKVKHTYASGGSVPASSNTNSYTYGTVAVTQNSQPVCWITRNLGAIDNATLVTDAGSASRGWFWQFNQKQGYSYESTTEAPATRTYAVSSSTNWALANDPCRILLGNSWHLPNKEEWVNVLNGGTIDNLYTKINLHRVGYLELFESGLKASGVNAHYWSSLMYNSADAYALNSYSGSSAVVIGAQKQNYGFPVRCVYLTSNTLSLCIPSAVNVLYNTDQLYIGGQLTGTYTYTADTKLLYPEDGTSFQWYQATDASGTGNTAISGATAQRYTIPSGTTGKYLRIGVKPRNVLGNSGVEVFSSWEVVLDPVPAYASASIGNQTSGCAANGTTVTADKGTYSVTPAVSGSEGTPVYQWYWATDATGTGKTAISGQTGSTHTVDASNTSFGYNNYSYLAVGITPKTLGGKTGSEVLSAWAPVWKCGSPYKVKHTYASGGPVPASSNTNSYTYGTVAVTHNSQPVCWITRNLGATADATLVTDAGSASRGWFWQFNQKQGYSYESTTEAPATRTYAVSSSTDWVLANDPCRSLLGNLWHLPTKSEWSSILSANSNADGLYNKVKLHMAGYLERSSKTLSQSGIGGFYWSLNVYDGTSDLAYALNGMSSVGSNYQGYAFPARCVFQTTEQASQSIPSATGVSYNTDRLYTSGVLTGQYTYVPDNTLKYPEQLSTYQWYQATDASGTGNTAISGATTKSYTIPSGMTGKYLRIGVKPRNELGNSGVEIFGSWILVVNPVPSYASVSIGRSIISDTKKTNLTAVKGTYLTTPATTGSEGTPTYQWYRATDASGTGKTAMLGQTAVTHLVDVTNGSYGYNNYSYLAVGITPQPVGDKSGVEKLSSWVPVWQCGETLTVVHTNGDGYSPLTATIAYETVPDNSTCWQGRNLGATEFNTAITNESRGWFYQWNTKQGYYTNGTTVTPTWVDNTNTDQLWATANDPCTQLGSTWHVPNKTQMDGMTGHYTGTRMGPIVDVSRTLDPKMYFLPVGFLDNGSFSSMGMLQMDFWMNGSDVNSTTWQVYDGGQNQYWNLRSFAGSYSIRCCK